MEDKDLWEKVQRFTFSFTKKLEHSEGYVRPSLIFNPPIMTKHPLSDYKLFLPIHVLLFPFTMWGFSMAPTILTAFGWMIILSLNTYLILLYFYFITKTYE